MPRVLSGPSSLAVCCFPRSMIPVGDIRSSLKFTLTAREVVVHRKCVIDTPWPLGLTRTASIYWLPVDLLCFVRILEAGSAEPQTARRPVWAQASVLVLMPSFPQVSG